MSQQSPVSFVANVARLPKKGMPVSLGADDKQRAALARQHELLSVETYQAELLVSPWKRDGVKVTGTVEADIVQACIVTLEPVSDHVVEAVESYFLPEGSKLGRINIHGGGEMVLDPEGPDSPETFAGDSIDVGALAEEFFALGIDPYPRKEGAELAARPQAEASSAQETPLQAQLRALARNDNGDDTDGRED